MQRALHGRRIARAENDSGIDFAREHWMELGELGKHLAP